MNPNPEEDDTMITTAFVIYTAVKTAILPVIAGALPFLSWLN